MDIKKVMKAIELDAGEKIPGLEQGLEEMKQGMAARVHTADQMLVREVRQKLKLSQANFAKIIHASITSLRDWEQGRHNPPSTINPLMTLLNNHPELAEELMAAD